MSQEFVRNKLLLQTCVFLLAMDNQYQKWNNTQDKALLVFNKDLYKNFKRVVGSFEALYFFVSFNCFRRFHGNLNI